MAISGALVFGSYYCIERLLFDLGDDIQKLRYHVS